MPANTFDNVQGNFPIGFFIWIPTYKIPFTSIKADVYGSNAEYVGIKSIALTPKIVISAAGLHLLCLRKKMR